MVRHRLLNKQSRNYDVTEAVVFELVSDIGPQPDKLIELKIKVHFYYIVFDEAKFKKYLCGRFIDLH